MPDPSAPPVRLVDLDDQSEPLAALPVERAEVVVGLTDRAVPDGVTPAVGVDLALPRGDAALDAILATVEQHPIASVMLVQLLRGAPGRSIDDGLLAESAVYSALQGGPEFAAWRAGRPRRDRVPEADPVLVDRAGACLTITLNRPAVRNALNTAMRDALVEAFVLPALDSSITEVHLRGAGPAFSTGGDLDEFGTFDDPASAHLVRLQQSVGRAIAAVADRVTAHLHGPCMGSGIELPAFAGRVVAHPGTTFSLPEVSLGLIPGAGGTVSLFRRVGSERTAFLALTGASIDATTALAWGLVDAIDEPVG